MPHCTPISSVTIIYHQVQGCHKFWAAGIDFQLLQAQFNDGLRVVSIQVLDFVISALTSHTCTEFQQKQNKNTNLYHMRLRKTICRTENKINCS